MPNIFVLKNILTIISIIIGFYIVLFIVKQKRTVNLEKKFNQFALSSRKDYDEAYLDILGKSLVHYIHKLSNLLSKSEVLKK